MPDDKKPLLCLEKLYDENLWVWEQVEATKFTETGFHGRDVDQIIRDLVENALALTKQKLRERNKQQIEKAVEEYILKELCGTEANKRTKVYFPS